MKKYQMTALSCVLDGRQEEFDAWYDRQHIPDCLKVPGFVSAQRFSVIGAPGPAAVPAWTTMVVYDLETDDLEGTLGQIKTLIRTPAMPVTDALDLANSIRFVTVEARPKVFANQK